MPKKVTRKDKNGIVLKTSERQPPNEMIIPRGNLKGYDAEQVQTWLIQEKRSWSALTCAYAAVENQVSNLMHDYDKEDEFFLEQYNKWVCLDKAIYNEIRDILIELNKEDCANYELTGGTLKVTLPYIIYLG